MEEAEHRDSRCIPWLNSVGVFLISKPKIFDLGQSTHDQVVGAMVELIKSGGEVPTSSLLTEGS